MAVVRRGAPRPPTAAHWASPPLPSPRAAASHSVLSLSNSRNRAPQSSCAQPRLLYAAFNPLGNAARVYLTRIPTRLLHGAFPGQFSRFSDGFDSFTRIATRALSPLEPCAVPRSQSTSALAQAAKALERFWAECRGAVDAICASGARPLLAEAAVLLDEIGELPSQAEQNFKATQQRSSLEASPIARLRSLLQRARGEFDARGAVEAQMLEFAENARVRFDQAMPLYFLIKIHRRSCERNREERSKVLNWLWAWLRSIAFPGFWG
jgi:hypothetical protein